MYDIAIGPDPEKQELRGHARGILAIGDIATGGIAIGGLAQGIVAVGGLSWGLIGVGGCTLGLLAALGGVAVGAFAVGGVAVGLWALGGVVVGLLASNPQRLASISHVPTHSSQRLTTAARGPHSRLESTTKREIPIPEEAAAVDSRLRCE